jgi:hypothetical protein
VNSDLGEGNDPVLFIAKIETNALDCMVKLAVFWCGLSREISEHFGVDSEDRVDPEIL